MSHPESMDPVVDRSFEMSYGALVWDLYCQSQRFEHDGDWIASKSTELGDTIAERSQLDREIVRDHLKQIWRHVAAAESPEAYYRWLTSGMPTSDTR